MTPDERAMRFGYLLSEIEVKARAILDGSAPDIVAEIETIYVNVIHAREIAYEVSREALYKVTRADQ